MTFLMRETDTLREKAAQLAAESREYEPGTPGYTMTRNLLAEVEKVIDALLLRYNALPKCPFCPGKMESTPTVGRLECNSCRALALKGRV